MRDQSKQAEANQPSAGAHRDKASEPQADGSRKDGDDVEGRDSHSRTNKHQAERLCAGGLVAGTTTWYIADGAGGPVFPIAGLVGGAAVGAYAGHTVRKTITINVNRSR